MIHVSIKYPIPSYQLHPCPWPNLKNTHCLTGGRCTGHFHQQRADQVCLNKLGGWGDRPGNSGGSKGQIGTAETL